jgi:hypothetical protein
MAIALVRAEADRGVPVATAIAEVRRRELERDAAAPDPIGDELFRNALDRLPVNVAILRAPDFRYVYINLALAQLVPGIKIGERLESVLQGIRGITALQQVVRTGETWYEPEEAVIIDGELRLFHATYQRLPAIPGHPHHVIAIGQETTEAVRAKRRLASLTDADIEENVLDSVRSTSMLRTLSSIAKSLDDGRQRTLKLLTERVCADLGADGATVAILNDGVLLPRVSTTLTRELRWRAIPTTQSPRLSQLLAEDSIGWLQTGRARNRDERAFLRRLVARTLCCAPIVKDGRPVGALLIRWSLNEYHPTVASANYIELARRLIKFAHSTGQIRALH